MTAKKEAGLGGGPATLDYTPNVSQNGDKVNAPPMIDLAAEREAMRELKADTFYALRLYSEGKLSREGLPPGARAIVDALLQEASTWLVAEWLCRYGADALRDRGAA